MVYQIWDTRGLNICEIMVMEGLNLLKKDLVEWWRMGVGARCITGWRCKLE